MHFRKTCLSTLFFFLSITFSYAAHIIGGEMSYVCNGDGNYTITIKMYRDCNGGGALFDSQPFAAVGQVTVYNGASSFPFQSVILDPPVVTPLNENISNQCLSNIPDLCVEEGVYTFDVNLPASPESYHLTYQRCCRNETISNIIDPGSTGATYTLEITPKAQGGCNNSPFFNDYPPIVICVNEPLMYDHSASDAEADSLVYEFCSPLRGGTLADVAPLPDAPPPYEPIDFITPTYSATTPLAGNPLVTINPNTGLITGTPTNIGQYVVGVCVKEYRNDELISVTQRDFQFNVTVCNFTVDAELDGMSTDGIHFNYIICGQPSVEMLNESFDLPNISEYQWVFTTPGVEPATASSANLMVNLPGAGTYEGMMVLNPGTACTDTAFVTIVAYPEVEAQINYEYEPCGAGPVQFDAATNISTDSIVEWSWIFGDGGSSSEESPLHQYAAEGVYDINLEVTDLNACVHTFSETINWQSTPDYNLTAAMNGSTQDGEHFHYQLCGTLSLDIINESTNPDNIDSYLWQFTTPGITPASASTADLSVALAAEGTYEGMLILNPGDDCNSDTAWLTIDAFPEVTVEIEYNYDPCAQAPVFFIPVNTAAEATISSWSWNFGDGATSEEALPSHQYATPGTYQVGLVITDIYGCSYTFEQSVNWLPEIAVSLPLPPHFEHCAPLQVDFTFLSTYLDSTYEVSWELGDGYTSEELDWSHEYTLPGTYDLYLSIVSPLGCTYEYEYPEWILVEEPPLADFAYAPQPVNKKELIQFEDLSERAVSWNWSFPDELIIDQHPEWTFKTADTYEVSLQVEDQYGCIDSMLQLIEVHPVLNVYVPNAFSPNDDGVNDTFLAYSSCPLKDFKMKIFDRWGAQVFESDDIEEGWNGHQQNESYDPGVFVWMITCELDERELVLKGDVTLVK